MTTYKGSTINTLEQNGSPTVSWTTSQGMLIVGGTQHEVENVIDAGGGSNILAQPTFRSTVGGDASDFMLMYLNVPGIASAIRATTGDTKTWDAQVAPVLNHLSSVVLTEKASADRVTLRLFVGVK